MGAFPIAQMMPLPSGQAGKELRWLHPSSRQPGCTGHSQSDGGDKRVPARCGNLIEASRKWNNELRRSTVFVLAEEQFHAVGENADSPLAIVAASSYPMPRTRLPAALLRDR